MKEIRGGLPEKDANRGFWEFLYFFNSFSFIWFFVM